MTEPLTDDQFPAPSGVHDSDLTRWREVANAASQEEWAYGPSNETGIPAMEMVRSCYEAGDTTSPLHLAWLKRDGEELLVAVTGNGDKSAANARHIAWAQPRNILALLADVDELRALAKELSRQRQEAADERDRLARRVGELEAGLREAVNGLTSARAGLRNAGYRMPLAVAADKEQEARLRAMLTAPREG